MQVEHPRNLRAQDDAAQRSEESEPEADPFGARADVGDKDNRNKLLDVEENAAEQEAARLHFDDAAKLGAVPLARRCVVVQVAGHGIAWFEPRG